MKKKTFVGKLIKYETLKNTYFGSPRYFGVFESEDGEILEATTASNANCAYKFLNNIEASRELTYHITKGGKVLIDYIKIRGE